MLLKKYTPTWCEFFIVTLFARCPVHLIKNTESPYILSRISRRRGRGQMKCDGTRAETRFRLSAKRTNTFKSTGPSVQSTAGSRCVRISGSNAGYTMFRGSVKVPATHSIRQFPLHFPFRASPCAITFQLESNIVNSNSRWQTCSNQSQ